MQRHHALKCMYKGRHGDVVRPIAKTSYLHFDRLRSSDPCFVVSPSLYKAESQPCDGAVMSIYHHGAITGLNRRDDTLMALGQNSFLALVANTDGVLSDLDSNKASNGCIWKVNRKGCSHSLH